MDPTSQAVMRAASELLRTEGPAALSNRKIAHAAGCTTMAIYSRFGSKSGVLDALYREGFATLAQAQQDVPDEGDPADELRALTQAYRRTAHDFAGHYALMFGGVPQFVPSPQARVDGLRTFERLTAACGRFLVRDEDEPEVISFAYTVFVACHGFVSLEASGYTPPGLDPDDAFEAVIERVLAS